VRVPRRSPFLTAAVVLAAVAGIGLRVSSLRGAYGASDSDEAIWTLMSRHVLDGEFPVYFLGPSVRRHDRDLSRRAARVAFGGGLGAARALALVLTCVATGLVWVVARRVLDTRRAAVAAALFWVWPAYTAWKSTRVHGFYVSGQILALLVLLLVLRLRERPRARDAAVLGLVVGLAAWQTVQVIPIRLPALAWLAWKRPSAYRLAWLAVPGLVLGSFPALYVNVRNGWWFHFLAPGGGTYISRLYGFFTAALSQQLGLRIPFSLDWLVPPAIGLPLVAAAVCLTAVLFVRHRHDDIGLLALVALVFPFVYALSPYTWIVEEPRYLFLLAPVIAMLVAVPLREPGVAAAALVRAVGLALVGQHAMGRGTTYESRNAGVPIPTDVRPLVRALDRRGITGAVSEYWLSYRIILATRERIILGNNSDDHYAPYRNAVEAAGPNTPHVYIAGSGDEVRARRQLERRGIRRDVFGGFSLWTRR